MLRMIECFGYYRPVMKTEQQYVDDMVEYMVEHTKKYDPESVDFDDSESLQEFITHLAIDAKSEFADFSIEVH